LPDGYEAHYLHYFSPLRSETLEQYACRLSDAIDKSKPFVLVGLSLGGIMATEIAKVTQPECTIVLSSVYSSRQLPLHFRMAAKLRLHRVIHPLFVKVVASAKNLITMKGMDNKKHMLKIIWSGSNRFIYWGMNAVLNWTNEVKPEKLYHIHGSMDEVFPIRNCQPDHVIRGSHMLVFNRAEQVNKLLEEILSRLNR
jgi:hypothetical protein